MPNHTMQRRQDIFCFSPRNQNTKNENTTMKTVTSTILTGIALLAMFPGETQAQNGTSFHHNTDHYTATVTSGPVNWWTFSGGYSKFIWYDGSNPGPSNLSNNGAPGYLALDVYGTIHFTMDPGYAMQSISMFAVGGGYAYGIVGAQETVNIAGTSTILQGPYGGYGGQLNQSYFQSVTIDGGLDPNWHTPWITPGASEFDVTLHLHEWVDSGGWVDANFFQFDTLTQTVPEPSSLAILTAGIGSLLAFRRRSNSACSSPQGGTRL